MKSLDEHFPSNEYNVFVETDQAKIDVLLKSRGSSCWGQGRIGDTGYFKLASPSKRSRDEKRLVIVCSNDKIS